MFEETYSYEDLLLLPKFSKITSRSQVNLDVKLPFHTFSHPIIPANMKTVTGPEMIKSIIKSNGLAILHRFLPIEEQFQIVKDINNHTNLAVSLGVKDNDRESAKQFHLLGTRIFCIDIAHGDSQACIDMIQFLKTLPDSYVIAGNVATGEAAVRLWKNGADLVKVGVGAGCFAAGTRILMANATYKNIEDISPGEYVINQFGKPTKVTDAFSTGYKEVIKIRNNSFHKPTIVTPDHQFWVGELSSSSKKTLSSKGYKLSLSKNTKKKESKFKWKQVKDTQNDVFLFPKEINFNLPKTFKIDLYKKTGGNQLKPLVTLDSTLVPNYNVGYIFGTYLGDGNSLTTVYNNSHRGSVHWTFGLNETSIANKLMNCLSETFKKNVSSKTDHNTISVNFYYKPFADFLKSFSKRTDKHLPQEFLVNSFEYLQGLYDGLMDSDGHYSKDGRNYFSNTSEKLVELFSMLSFIIKKQLPNGNSKPPSAGGLVCNIENCNTSFYYRDLKNPSVRVVNDYFIVKPLESELLQETQETFELTIEDDSHSFIANNAIVHNSICLTRIETGCGMPQLSAVIDVYNERKKHFTNPQNYPFIADGGIKSAGDIVKALCFADFVMAGNTFAGCQETPGEVFNIAGKKVKEYTGSSTYKTKHVEGVAALVEPKGTFEEVLLKIKDGLQSGCSYQGAKNLQELKVNPKFVKISQAGIKESNHHDVFLK